MNWQQNDTSCLLQTNHYLSWQVENNTSDTDYVILIYQIDAMECTGSYFHLHLPHNWIQKYTIDKLAVQSPWLQTLFQDMSQHESHVWTNSKHKQKKQRSLTRWYAAAPINTAGVRLLCQTKGEIKSAQWTLWVHYPTFLRTSHKNR